MGRLARNAAGPLAAGALALALLGLACASGRGASHVLRPGENLYRLSRYYQVPVRDIARANDIRDATEIPVGEALWIPGTRRAQPGHSLAVVQPTRAAPSGDLRAKARKEAELVFGWPVHGKVSSRYGWRGGRSHDGIDIPAKKGTKIHAAESGRVIHAGGKLGDYGKVVILKHAGRYQTIYAHNRKNLVHEGQFVEKGDVIAEVGTSGNASGPHVHFEVRRDRRPLDPLSYLP